MNRNTLYTCHAVLSNRVEHAAGLLHLNREMRCMFLRYVVALADIEQELGWETPLGFESGDSFEV